MDWGLHIYAIDPTRGHLYLGQTFANQLDTVGDVESRIVSDVLSNIEGLGRSTPINMVAVHIDGKRMDHEVDFRDPTKLFTKAIKTTGVLAYRSFNVIIEVDNGSNQNNNRGRSSTRSSPSTRSVSRSARSRSRSSTRSPSTRSTSKHSRSRSTSRNNTLKKRQHQ